MIESALVAAASVERLRRLGIFTTDVRTVLGHAGAQAFSREAAAVVHFLTTAGLDASLLGPGLSRSAIFDLALAPCVLDLFGRAMETRHVLTAVHARHDDARQLPGHLRSWHIDAEDRRMIRMIVYLVDVTPDDAAFEGTPLTDRVERIRAQSEGDCLSNPMYRPVSDAELSDLIPRNEWMVITGPKLTVVSVATGLILHHVRPGTGHRWSLTFTYLPRSSVPMALGAFPGWLTPGEKEAYGIEAAPSSRLVVQP